jgi:hypothetical protein
MDFSKRYTTIEKKTEDEKKPVDLQREKGKIALSNDAFAIGEEISNLIQKIDLIRRPQW